MAIHSLMGYCRLLRAAKEAGNRHTEVYLEIIREIGRDHVKQMEVHIRSENLRLLLREEIERELGKLTKFLGAVEEIGEVSAKSLDTVISKGELLACLFMSALLRDRGVDAECLDLSDLVNFEGDTDDLDNLFYKRLTSALVEKIQACGSKVPVVTGYFGKVKEGLLNKIGRGYTDLCAALIAVGIQAQELQIWKEVDGPYHEYCHETLFTKRVRHLHRESLESPDSAIVAKHQSGRGRRAYILRLRSDTSFYNGAGDQTTHTDQDSECHESPQPRDCHSAGCCIDVL